MRFSVLSGTYTSKCPYCGVVVKKYELESHIEKHLYDRKLHNGRGGSASWKMIRIKLECRCGKSFVSRERIRRHIKNCPSLKQNRKEFCCTSCHKNSEILLENDGVLICPECALKLYARKEILDIPVINTLEDEQTDTFKEASIKLMRRLGVKKLEELGVVGVIITSSESYLEYNAANVAVTPPGIIVFILDNVQSKDALKTFSILIPSRLYRNHLKITLNMEFRGREGELLSLFEHNAINFAERIVCTKKAVQEGINDVLHSEVEITRGLVENLPAPSKEYFSSLTCEEWFSEISELCFRFSQMEWFIVHLGDGRIRDLALKNKKILQDYVDIGRGAALVVLFRTRFSYEISDDDRENTEFINGIVRAFDVWTGHEKLGLF